MLLDNLEETSVVQTGIFGQHVNLSHELVQLNLECAPGLFLGPVLLELLCLGAVVRELAMHLANFHVLETVHLFELAFKQLDKVALVGLVPQLEVGAGLDHVLEFVVGDVVERPFGLNGFAQVLPKFHGCEEIVSSIGRSGGLGRGGGYYVW